MLRARQAAILIAAFLLISLDGCYTKFRLAETKLVPDDNKTVVYDDWEFSRGWYRDGIEVYAAYYDYYYGQWWDQCVWCGDNNTVRVIATEPAGKIDRRDYHDMPPLHHDDNIPQHPYEYSDPIGQAQQPKFDDPPPAGADQPKIENNNDQSKSSQGNSDEKETDGTKIKRRGRS